MEIYLLILELSEGGEYDPYKQILIIFYEDRETATLLKKITKNY